MSPNKTLKSGPAGPWMNFTPVGRMKEMIEALLPLDGSAGMAGADLTYQTIAFGVDPLTEPYYTAAIKDCSLCTVL